MTAGWCRQATPCCNLFLFHFPIKWYIFIYWLTSSSRAARGPVGLKDCFCSSLSRAQECIFRLYRLRCAGKPEKRTWHRKRAQQGVLSLSHTSSLFFLISSFPLRDILILFSSPAKHFLFNELFPYFYLYLFMFDVSTEYIWNQ